MNFEKRSEDIFRNAVRVATWRRAPRDLIFFEEFDAEMVESSGRGSTNLTELSRNKFSVIRVFERTISASAFEDERVKYRGLEPQ